MMPTPPPRSIRCLSAIGPAHPPRAKQVSRMSGHIRVGPGRGNGRGKGVPATQEAPVARSARVAEGPDPEPVSPAQTRQGIGPKPLDGG